MSLEANKRAVRRYIEEVLGEGRLESVDELFAAAYGGIGPGAARSGALAFRTAFPDALVRIDELMAEDDRVVVKVTCEGTHRDAFLGIPATGGHVRFEAVELAVFDKDGRIVRQGWHVMDSGALTCRAQAGQPSHP